MVAEGTDLHTLRLERLHSRQDPWCTEREALETMIDMVNENQPRLYTVDRQPDAPEIAHVTLEHRQDVAVVELSAFAVHIAERVMGDHMDLVHTLDWIGYDINVH
jgi:hypothetical protein